MALDLSPILGKHITFPLLCYVSYKLYQDLSETKCDCNAPGVFDSSDASVFSRKISPGPVPDKSWQPLQAMQTIRPASDEEDHKPWNETEPFPYKPFKPGEYRLTMGVRPMAMDHWLVYEKTLKPRIEHKWKLIAENYKDVIYHLDPAMVNCDTYDNASVKDRTLVTLRDVEKAHATVCEWYNAVISFLLLRFPEYYEVVLQPNDSHAGVLHNKIMDEFHPVDAVKYTTMENSDLTYLKYRCYNTDIIPEELTNPNNLSDKVGRIPLVTTLKTRRGHELILAVERMVEEDLLLLSPNANSQFDNEYIMIAGCFAFAAGFNPRERFLRPMTQIHGPVPEYKVKLQSQMNKFFQTHKPNKLVMRLNFSFQTHPHYYVTNENKGSDNEQIRAKTLQELDGGHDLHYRSERQCLVKFENTQSMCFSVKTYLWNLQDEFLQNQFYSQEAVIDDLCDAVKGMQDSMGQYKRKPEWGPALLEMLETALHRNI